MSARPAGGRRVALVTGAVGGIGAAVCRRLAAEGFALAVSGLERPACEELAAGLPGEGHHPVACDVTDEAAVEALFDEAETRLGPVSVLVCGAAVLLLREGGRRPLLVETTLEEWERTQAVNGRGTFLCLRSFLRRRQERPLPDGRVVTFSSVAAQLGGYRASSAYIASKAAILGLTKAAAREAAPLGITVNCVAPGLIDAPMLRLSLPPGAEGEAAAAIPLQRIGSPEEVADAVAFLASPGAGYITGATIDINGGYRMQ
ncbi:3-oxoacyl-[acyl-carrier protein] reductase [Tistlia consotensis]|uniref:3-oxoacyl-[acyl-carrier protein] reductase n=1 Tax=Tistlia consotensis USBA 355 TaxID=560819 RepID=A0A1Y6BXY0_9PROT|nr:SDR family NAD(P)-dependent oxidoreductase [Tistlia consotensis]SMF35580.1 3-oxoacyl-[acyl-carrier protein] reductase [Tistlia consotensis USBA 355]SNR70972.1 3-oxoacyl-[acyl-carrier protein] reductase [Tistlia consotensis]